MSRVLMIIAGCLLLLWTKTCGQHSYTLGTLPNVNVGIALGASWKLNWKIESRQILIRGDERGAEARFEFKLLDFGTILSRKFKSRNTLGLGYLIRFEDHQAGHRFIQQFAFGSTYRVITFAHRLSADQTFRASEPPEYRLRYRIGVEIPINGQAIDPGEPYLKFTNEQLGILQGVDTDLEVRTLGILGIFFHEKRKIETGLEYRVSGFFNHGTKHVVWLNLGCFWSF